MDKKLLGKRINTARKDQKLTGEKLAEACNINATFLGTLGGGNHFIEVDRDDQGRLSPSRKNGQQNRGKP